jgi:cupin fold WbuC family metalloprotein
MPFERLSPFATVSLHEKVLGIDPHVIYAKCRDAGANPRKREILNLQRGPADPLQRMLNAMQPGSYVRPHRHISPPKAEALVLLRGAVGFMTFTDGGAPDFEGFVFLHHLRGAVALDCREGVWHTFFALEPDTVLYEAKNGPFDAATDKEAAPWAPPEGTAEAGPYLERLEDAFRSELPRLANAGSGASLRAAIPVLHVSSSVEAERFYCSLLGFRQEFAYRPFGGSDPCYMALSRDGVLLHVSSFSGDGVAGGVVVVEVVDVDRLHAELVAKGVAIDTGPIDQSWGNREMYVKDADRNSIRFTQLGGIPQYIGPL